MSLSSTRFSFSSFVSVVPSFFSPFFKPLKVTDSLSLVLGLVRITSKWSGAWMGEKQLSITDSLKASLAKLKIEYLDLYL